MLRSLLKLRVEITFAAGGQPLVGILKNIQNDTNYRVQYLIISTGVNEVFVNWSSVETVQKYVERPAPF